MIISLEIKRRILLAMYTVLDSYQQRFQLACHKGCSSCCTQSVMMTELEGESIVDFYVKHIGRVEELQKQVNNHDYAGNIRPVTANSYAKLFLEKESPEEENLSWNFESCIFLKNGECSIYSVRPLGCRTFISEIDCKKNGTAEALPVTITISIIFQQLAEHLDKSRMWGVMNHILIHNLLREGTKLGGLSVGETLPGFLIPQEEKAEVEGLLDTLYRINVGGKTVYEYLF